MDKKLLSVVGLVIVVVALTGILLMRAPKTETNDELTPTPVPVVTEPLIVPTSTEQVVDTSVTSTGVTTTSTQAAATTTAKVPQSVPVVEEKPTEKSYTMAQVAAHPGEGNCWTAINGSVYDLSTWVERHPGGDRNILKICGIDGSSAFTGKHGGNERPEATLASFRIGSLAK